MIVPNLADALNRTEFVALNICRGREGLWQASLQSEKGGGWRVCHGATPSAAIVALFEPVPQWVPPCPVALPACPVGLP